jgi:hypothetical protein
LKEKKGDGDSASRCSGNVKQETGHPVETRVQGKDVETVFQCQGRDDQIGKGEGNALSP